jgi:hypothetical protein
MLDIGDAGPMSEEAAREEIARLEARIEALTVSLERCRKISLAARLTLAAGTTWMGLMFVGVIPSLSFHLVGAIAAVLGGIVLFGSNNSTWKQMLAARADADARRIELIDRMRLRVIDEPQRTLH